MRLLVLGGTAWLGRTVAGAAVADGHDVTCLARGDAGAPPVGVAFVKADRERDDALDALAGASFDAVIDLARHPGHVRRAVTRLHDRVGHYVFVSAGNVYADQSTPYADEAAPLLAPLRRDAMSDMDEYGPAKVAGEQHVLGAFGPDRAAIARCGLIGGPGDRSGRSGYWPWRFARAGDGRVLAPDALDQPTQVIDVRDLAAWLLHVAAARDTGVFNATGPVVSLGEHLRTAAEVAGFEGRLVLAAPDWLTARGVQPWAGEASLPLWLNDPEWDGFLTRDIAAARRAGLAHRPLHRTLADALDWEQRRPAEIPRAAGLSDSDERALLDELSA